MNSDRTSANWISALLCALSIVFFLIAPFYSILTAGISGLLFLRFHLVAIIPLILGMVAALGACILPPIVGIILESVYTLAILLFMGLGNQLAVSFINNGLNVPPEWASYVNPVVSLVPVIRIGWGSLVCLFLSIAAVVVDIIINLPRRQQKSSDYILGSDDDIMNGGFF